MGGKGRRRRERNYRAAHGGYDRLPPPPDASQVDALPSKLRKLISLTSSQPQEPEKVSKDTPQKHKREAVKAEKKSHPKDDLGSVKDGRNGGNSQVSQLTGSGDDVRSKSSEKKNRKRKRKQVNDLRFETPLENSDRRLKKRERQKKYQEAKKNKHKKAKTEDLDFSRHEKVKFGDVVEAPPKLVAVPKAFKSTQNASLERKRLHAINEYRNRKGWTSRPGIQLPSMTIPSAI